MLEQLEKKEMPKWEESNGETLHLPNWNKWHVSVS